MSNRDMCRVLGVASALLVCQLWASQAATANPIAIDESFTTTGTVGTDGLSGSPAVTFQGVTNGVAISGTPFGLGQFVVTPPSEGTTTYNGVKFTIDFQAHTVAGGAIPPGSVGHLEGILDGTISSSGASTLVARFTPIPVPTAEPWESLTPQPTFRTGGFISTLMPLPTEFDGIPLTPSGTGSTFFPVLSNIVITPAPPIPEPGTLAIFASALGAIAVRRLRKRA